jgi:hypothetical protein
LRLRWRLGFGGAFEAVFQAVPEVKFFEDIEALSRFQIDAFTHL